MEPSYRFAWHENRGAMPKHFEFAWHSTVAFEQAWRRGETQWPKPISCHLYPIRIKELQDFSALNVHQWPICDAARSCGAASQTNVLDFCKTALVRRFGEDWYDEAQEVCKAWKEEQAKR